jgi:hypothetical protein
MNFELEERIEQLDRKTDLPAMNHLMDSIKWSADNGYSDKTGHADEHTDNSTWTHKDNDHYDWYSDVTK